MALDEDISRGIGTYIASDSPILGVADALFGSDPSDPAQINRNTAATQESFGSSAQEATTNQSQEASALSSALSGSTALTDNVTQNTGLQSQTGLQGIGAFTGQTGLGQAGYDPVTGQFNAALAQPYAANANQALAASGQAYGALGGQNFDGTMAQRYNALEALQEQDRLQAQRAMEDRLYSQGRLGSTGGALQQNALMDAIAQQQAGNLNTSFNQAMAQRQQFGDQALQFGQGALQPQQLSLQQLQAMGALAPQVSSNQVTTDNLSEYSGLQDTTGFQDTASSNVANTSSNTLQEALDYERDTGIQAIRSVDEGTPIPSLSGQASTEDGQPLDLPDSNTLSPAPQGGNYYTDAEPPAGKVWAYQEDGTRIAVPEDYPLLAGTGGLQQPAPNQNIGDPNPSPIGGVAI